MKHTLKYFFSSCLMMCLFLAKAQETKPTNSASESSKIPQTKLLTPISVGSKTVEIQTDSISVPTKADRYGVRVGVDLFKLTKALYDKNYKGIEFVGDYRLTKKYFLAAELGNESKTTEDTRLNSTTKGTYLKGGFDYNGYTNWLDMENIISIGMRYGLSTFSQQLNSYKTYNPNPYFGEVPFITSGDKYNGLTASWIEVVLGMKAKVFNNVFMGFSFRMNKLITNKQPGNFENLYIPGFNRTYNGDFGVGFNYTVTYFIPIFKKKLKPIAVAKKVDTKK